jgi:hypothetical protein
MRGEGIIICCVPSYRGPGPGPDTFRVVSGSPPGWGSLIGRHWEMVGTAGSSTLMATPSTKSGPISIRRWSRVSSKKKTDLVIG